MLKCPHKSNIYCIGDENFNLNCMHCPSTKESTVQWETKKGQWVSLKELLAMEVTKARQNRH